MQETMTNHRRQCRICEQSVNVDEQVDLHESAAGRKELPFHEEQSRQLGVEESAAHPARARSMILLQVMIRPSSRGILRVASGKNALRRAIPSGAVRPGFGGLSLPFPYSRPAWSSAIRHDICGWREDVPEIEDEVS
jgi:hypothetical protein